MSKNRKNRNNRAKTSMSDEEVSKLIKEFSGTQSRTRGQPEGIVRPGETR